MPIDAKQWARVRVVFDELVDLDDDARGRRLSIIETTDPELHRVVAELLAADAVADARLAGVDVAIEQAVSVYDHRTPELGPDPLSLVGRTVSHFTVHEQLATGGMGVLYLAEDMQLRRNVALKFPLPSRHVGQSVSTPLPR